MLHRPRRTLVSGVDGLLLFRSYLGLCLPPGCGAVTEAVAVGLAGVGRAAGDGLTAHGAQWGKLAFATARRQAALALRTAPGDVVAAIILAEHGNVDRLFERWVVDPATEKGFTGVVGVIFPQCADFDPAAAVRCEAQNVVE